MKSYKETLMILIPTLAIFVGIIWLATPAQKSAGQSGYNRSESAVLVVENPKYDFGTISMAKGKVSHLYVVKNIGSEPVVIDTAYTSCMCTAATLVIGEKRFGPFGMPGHGFLPKLSQVVPAGGEIKVEGVFDPAAHGPAGVGTIERVIVLESASGNVEMQFKALVTP